MAFPRIPTPCLLYSRAINNSQLGPENRTSYFRHIIMNSKDHYGVLSKWNSILHLRCACSLPTLFTSFNLQIFNIEKLLWYFVYYLPFYLTLHEFRYSFFPISYSITKKYGTERIILRFFFFFYRLAVVR